MESTEPSAEGDLRRGYWEDAQTFVLEILDIGKQTIRVHFEGDKIIFEALGLGMRLEGKPMN